MSKKSKEHSRKYQSPAEKHYHKAKEELDLITSDANKKKIEAEKAEQIKQANEIKLTNANVAENQAKSTYQDKLNFEIRLKNEAKSKTDAAKTAADQLKQAQEARNEIPGDEAILQCHSPHRAVIACRQQNQEKQKRNEQKQQQRQEADNDINSKQNLKNVADIEASNAIRAADDAKKATDDAKNTADAYTRTKNTALEEFNKAKKTAENAQQVSTEADGKKAQVEISFTAAQKEHQQEIDLLFGDGGDEDITIDHLDHKVDKIQEDIIETTGGNTQCAGDHIEYEF